MAVEDERGEAHLMHSLLQQLSSLEYFEAQLAGLEQQVLPGATGRHADWRSEA